MKKRSKGFQDFVVGLVINKPLDPLRFTFLILFVKVVNFFFLLFDK